MISMASLNLPERAMRQQIASAIQVVVQCSRMSDGKRKIVSVSEVVGMEGEVITMQDIFEYRRKGVDADGNVLGAFQATGIRPRFSERLAEWGLNPNEFLFSDDDDEHRRAKEW